MEDGQRAHVGKVKISWGKEVVKKAETKNTFQISKHLLLAERVSAFHTHTQTHPAIIPTHPMNIILAMMIMNMDRF